MQKNEPTGMKDTDLVGIEDEIGAEITANAHKQLAVEKELWTTNLEKAKAAVANYEEQWKVELRLWELQLTGDNIRAVEPSKKVELLDEWWALQKKMAEFKFREVKHMGDAKLEQLKAAVEQCADELAKVEESIARLG